MHPIVDHADAQEERARDQAVAQHLEDCALHAGLVAGENPHGHEAHVGDRRIGDQLLDVRLTEGDQRGVDDGDHRQRQHQRREHLRRLREHRNVEQDEAVAAQLQQDAGQDDRTRRRRLNVSVRQPGVHRPHWHLHREGGEEGQPQQRLHRGVEGVLLQLRNAGGAGRVGHPQHGQQHQHRPEQGVQEELVRRVDPVGAAPDADDQVHRDQGAFEEDVEEEQVQRGEHPDDQRLQDQEGDHVLDDARLDRLPAGHDADRQQEGRQQDEQDRNPVNAQVIAGARKPGVVLDELIGRVRRIELGDQQDGHRQHHHGGGKGDPAGGRGRSILTALVQQARDQDRGRAEKRQEGDDAQNVRHEAQAPHVKMAKARNAATPISITNA